MTPLWLCWAVEIGRRLIRWLWWWWCSQIFYQGYFDVNWSVYFVFFSSFFVFCRLLWLSFRARPVLMGSLWIFDTKLLMNCKIITIQNVHIYEEHLNFIMTGIQAFFHSILSQYKIVSWPKDFRINTKAFEFSLK